MTAQLTEARRKQVGVRTPDGIPMKATGHRSDDYCVASFDLVQVLEPMMKRLAIQLRANGFENASGDGEVEVTCGRAARAVGWSEEAAIRRLYAARAVEARAISTEWAEAYLSGFDEMIEDQETLPTLPGGADSALEMVRCHYEYGDDETPDEVTIHRQARMLHKFTLGYLAGVNYDTTTDTEEWARIVAAYRLDFYNRSPSGKTDPVMRRESGAAA